MKRITLFSVKYYKMKSIILKFINQHNDIGIVFSLQSMVQEEPLFPSALYLNLFGFNNIIKVLKQDVPGWEFSDCKIPKSKNPMP